MRARMLRNPGWLMVAALGAACPPPDEGNGDPPPLGDQLTPFLEHPETKRLAPGLLPWRARGGTHVLRRVTYFDEDANPPAPAETEGLLATITARGDRLAIVFAPDDREGFDLAQAGHDVAWTRTHLTDLPLASIGAIDAAAGPDGTLHVVLRERTLPGRLHHLVIHADDTVTATEIPRPSEIPANFDLSTCDDVALGVTPAGAVDVAFQHSTEHAMRTQVVLARRAAGSTAWTHVIGLDTKDAVPDGSVPVWGCRNRLAYDEDWQPFLATLVSGVKDGTWSNFAVTLLTGADGLLYRAPYAIDVDDWGPWWRPDFDVARSDAGFVVLGNNTNFDDAFLQPVPMHGVKDFLLPRLGVAGEWKEHRFNRREFARHGGRIFFEQPGSPVLVTSRPSKAPFIEVRYRDMHGSPVDRSAPVFRRDRPQRVVASTLTHGVGAFDAALCLYDDDALGICFGGVHLSDFTANELAEGRLALTPTEALYKVVAHNLPPGVAEGTAGMPAGAFTLEATLTGKWDPRRTQLGVGVYDDVAGARGLVTATLDAATGRVTLPVTLVAGRRHWIAFPFADLESAILPPIDRAKTPVPVLSFQVAGTFRDDTWNPRETRVAWTDCTGRDPSGRCIVDADSSGPLSLRVPATRHLRAIADIPRLFDQNGILVPDVTVRTEVWDGQSLVLVDAPATVPRDADWLLRLPELADTQYGTRFTEADRELILRGDPGPFTLDTSTPADGAVDVDLEAPLRLRFNRAVEYQTVVNFVTLTRTSDASPVALTVLQDDPRTFTLGHDPFTAGTTYRLELGERLRTLDGEELGRTIAVAFSTRVQP